MHENCLCFQGEEDNILTNGLVNGTSDPVDDSNKDVAPKASLRLSFLEYQRISNLIVMHLRRSEEGKDLPSGEARILQL